MPRSHRGVVVTRHKKIKPSHDEKENINNQLLSPTAAWTATTQSHDEKENINNQLLSPTAAWTATTQSHDEKENINNQLVSPTAAWTATTQSLDLQPSTSTTKMIPNGTNHHRRPSSVVLFTYNYDKSLPQQHSNDRKLDSTDKKTKYSKPLLIIFAIIIALSALGALAIGIYLVIRITDTSTTSTSTATSTTFQLRWQKAGTTVAGLGLPANAALDRFSTPYGITIDSFDALFVADYNNNRIEKFSKGGSVATTVAGQTSGTIGSTVYDLYYPTSVLVDSSGNLYVSDSANYRVQLFANGSFVGLTVAGTGFNGSLINELSSPRGLARDSASGTLYVVDNGNHRVVSYLSGTPTVVAGGNGPGTLNTQLNSPVGLAFDSSSKSLYIANFGSHNIVRWVVGSSTWTLVAGSPTGTPGSTSMMLYYPTGVTLDSMGNVYVADYINNRIQMFTSGNSSGTTIAGVTSIAGNIPTLLYYPYSVAFDSAFNLYVADTVNQRIQKFLRY